jgi:protein-S-isoprenylcysteine O-methyltransferase Ste14
VKFVYQWILAAIWLTWLVYWMLARRNIKRTVRKEEIGSRLLHVIPILLAALLLLFNRVPIGFLNYQLFPRSIWELWLGSLITVIGLLFTVWARVHIGRNWSGMVTVKDNHELITSGPYGIVRHPIYTGLLIAFIGSAVVRDEIRGVMAVVLVFAALWRKLRLEERWMHELFGDQYLAYCQRVPALVPFLK